MTSENETLDVLNGYVLVGSCSDVPGAPSLSKGVVINPGIGIRTPGKMLFFNYPAGNDDAKRLQEENASRVRGFSVIAVPRSDANWSAVESHDMTAHWCHQRGDTILFLKSAGWHMNLNGEDVCFVPYTTVVAVVVKKEKKS